MHIINLVSYKYYIHKWWKKLIEIKFENRLIVQFNYESYKID